MDQNSIDEANDFHLRNLLESLKSEIATKDQVLGDRRRAIESLEKKLAECNGSRLAMGSELNSLHGTVSRLNKLNQELQEEKRTLALQLAEKDNMVIDTQKQLERQIIECEQQKDQCTGHQEVIGQLRRLLEETRRKGVASVVQTKEINNVLNSNIRSLSEQLNTIFKENLSKDRQIQAMRDCNLELREQIDELQKDIIDYKELIDIKNLRCENEWAKQNEINAIKIQLKVVQEENSRLFRGPPAKMQEAPSHDTSDPEMSDMQDKMKQLLTLTQETAQIQFKNQHYQELLKEVKEHQESLDELAVKNQELYAILRNYKAKHRELETHVGNLSYENSNLHHDVERLKSEISEKSKENALLAQDCAKVKLEFKTHKDQCRCKGSNSPSSPKVRLNLQLQIQNLRREVQEKNHDNDKLKEKLKKVKSEYDKTIKNASLDRERMHLEITELIEVVSKQKSQSLALQNEKKQTESEALRAIEARNSSEIKCQNMEKQLQEMEKRVGLLLMKEENLKQQVQELQEQRCKLVEEHTNTETRTMEELKCARQSIRDLQIRIATQEDNFKRLVEVKKELEEKLEGFLRENQRLRHQVSGEAQTKNALLDLVGVLENEQQSLKNKICSLTNTDQDLGKAMGTIENLRINCQDLASKYQKLQVEHDELQQEYNSLLYLREQSLKTLKSSELNQTENREKVQILRAKIDEMFQSIKILLQERESLLHLIDEKHRDVTILSHHHPALGKRVASSESLTALHKPFIPSDLRDIQGGTSGDSEIDVFDEIQALKSRISHLTKNWSFVLKGPPSEHFSVTDQS